MAETLVENQICWACGADVRPNALFCYNCGGSVAPEAAVELKDKDEDSTGEARFRRIIAEGKNGDHIVQPKQKIIEETVSQSIAHSNSQTKTELKSAAAMRRKSKIYQSKKVEVVWEEHDNAPNGWFIFVALLLTLLAAGISYLAIYLK